MHVWSLEDQQRQHPISTMYVYGRNTHSTFRLLLEHVSLPQPAAMALEEMGRNLSGGYGVLELVSLFWYRARGRQLRFLGIGYAMIPDAGASEFLLFSFRALKDGVKAGVPRLISPRRSLREYMNSLFYVQIARCLCGE
jgi:hypothetical protein